MYITKKTVRLCGPQQYKYYNKNQHGTLIFQLIFLKNKDCRLICKCCNFDHIFSCSWCVLSYILLFWVFLGDLVSLSVYMNVFKKEWDLREKKSFRTPVFAQVRGKKRVFVPFLSGFKFAFLGEPKTQIRSPKKWTNIQHYWQQ